MQPSRSLGIIKAVEFLYKSVNSRWGLGAGGVPPTHYSPPSLPQLVFCFFWLLCVIYGRGSVVGGNVLVAVVSCSRCGGLDGSMVAFSSTAENLG